ncbi:MFS transporter [Nitrosomonas supralitoralis]|uniref:MFS transporter n=1 Tax=Nitrosomonas supralitoralis TaxID=2116706 RepID=A0A2P7NV08_9PROT|nr:MFS transporter [Nitrosomonas supralitoralis]PSJ17265.1 MFS transporter [Nitrosomonas supralitoralis]
MNKPDQPNHVNLSVAKKLPQTVVVLGLVSFFNDFASDIVVPLIPILLATVFAAGPVALGLIEGVADALASFLKLWSGRHTDMKSGRRKGLVLTGYMLSNLARPLLGLAGSWVTVLLLRSVDRVGKGLRSAPRDAMVADATPSHIRGYAFGFHRALDNAGAVAGGLTAAAVLAWSDLSLSEVILWSAVPGFAAIVLLGAGIKEKKGDRIPPEKLQRTLSPLRWSALSVPMQHYLWVLMLFTFARASETFILLFGHELGISVVELLLLWSALNLAKAITSTQGGQLANHFGRGALILIGWSALAISFLAISQITTSIGLWMISICYGLFMGMSEGAERALISDYASPDERGTAFGWYHLVSGIAAIPSGLLFGVIWHVYNAAAAFIFASVLAFLAIVLLRVWAWPARQGYNE